MKKQEILNDSQNILFSELKGTDLKEILNEIENYYLTYRDTLNLSSNVSFGVEIEVEKVKSKLAHFFTKVYASKWKYGMDYSLKDGCEISSAILHDIKSDWKALKKVCTFLRNMNASTIGNAGGHVHIGAHIIGSDLEAWRKFYKIFAVYEPIFYRFGYGDKLNPREEITEYANPIQAFQKKRKPLKKCHSVKRIFYPKDDYDDRYRPVNICNVTEDDMYNEFIRNTAEFRFPNATTEEIIWQNNINAFAKMMLASKNTDLDQEFLEYKMKERKNHPIPYRMYQEIFLEDALELVDLIFDNNLDKTYFLRQYLKDFQVIRTDCNPVYAKKFIRR